jgi:23S rRNA pseudouridine1911/1915/1917 synthase
MTDELELQEDEQDLYEHHRIVVDKGQSPLRIDKFLTIHLKNAIRNKIQNAIHAGTVLVNDKPIKPNYKIKPDDIISVVLSYPPNETEIVPEDIPLTIVYEDDDVLIVNKSPEMVVHPGFGNWCGTLVNALAFHFEKGVGGQVTGNRSDPSPSPDTKYPKTDTRKPYLVHRIDKGTSGLLLVAKNEIAQSFLAKQFFDHTIERKYQALVWGDFDTSTPPSDRKCEVKSANAQRQTDPSISLGMTGTIVGNIGRSLKDRKVMTVFPSDGTPDGDRIAAERGKHAVTHYNVLERFGYVTLVECALETGRTHQIRAHMKYIKHPLFNDAVYGGDQILKGTIYTKYKQFVQNCFDIIPRHALHAKTLGFIHPATKKYMLFDSELPPDFASVLKKWRSYVQFNETEEVS